MNRKKLFQLAALLLPVLSFAQSPLPIPPALSGTIFNLTIQNGTSQFYPSVNTPTYGVNGPLLAPTLILNKWDTVTINVTNTLTGNGNSTTMHWHGLHVPPEADGGPHQEIMQNATWSPSFRVLNDAGTFWYHPHGAGKTDLHVSKGLSGMIIVRDSAEAALVLPRNYGVDDFPVIVQTKSFDILNQIAISTGYDTVPMVNGVIDSYLNAPAQVVRLRLLNGSSGRSFMFGFSNNMNFHLIATDGGLVDTAVTMNRLLLSNGERAEILVDLSAMLNDTVFLMNYGSEIPFGIMGADSVGDMTNFPMDYYDNFLNGADFNLLQINVGPQSSSPVTTIPLSLVPHTVWPASAADHIRRFELDTLSDVFVTPNPAAGPFGINRTFFDMDSVNERVWLGDIEIWTIHNKTMVAHPFHIHDIQFYILDINGGPVPLSQQGKKDVVLVMPGDSVRVITKFDDFANDSVPYMYHCHLLHHEDDGMMGSFLVLDTLNSSVYEPGMENFCIVYPNPASGELNLRLDHDPAGDDVFLQVYNATGQLILAQPITDTSTRINTQNWPAGLYSFAVLRNGKLNFGKIVISR